LLERALKRAQGKPNLPREVGRRRNDDMLISWEMKKKAIEIVDNKDEDFFNG
jgi:hypothetical protein